MFPTGQQLILGHMQDAADESNMPNAWKMDAGDEPVNFQEPRL